MSIISEQNNEELCAEIKRRTDCMERVWAHYDHAREKHPHFCDRLLPDWPIGVIKSHVAENLEYARSRIKAGVRDHNLMWNELANCEVWEATEAIANGDTAHAVEECYDAIAVLLRVIDVLEGRQPLGRPGDKEGVKQ